MAGRFKKSVRGTDSAPALTIPQTGDTSPITRVAPPAAAPAALPVGKELALGTHASAPHPTAKRKRRPTKRLPVEFDLHKPGRCRIGHLMTLLQISPAKLYADLKRGRLPKPDGDDGRPFWNNSTICGLLDQ